MTKDIPPPVGSKMRHQAALKGDKPTNLLTQKGDNEAGRERGSECSERGGLSVPKSSYANHTQTLEESDETNYVD